jgi:prevent-host-death family protein
MNFYTVRDLRTHPREVWDKLSETQEIIITNNGKPTALMIEIDDENLEEVLASVRQSMAMRAVNKLRIASVRSGRSEMTSEDIDEEIYKARKEKRECSRQ